MKSRRAWDAALGAAMGAAALLLLFGAPAAKASKTRASSVSGASDGLRVVREDVVREDEAGLADSSLQGTASAAFQAASNAVAEGAGSDAMNANDISYMAPAIISLKQDEEKHKQVVAEEQAALLAQEKALEGMVAEQERLASEQANLETREASVEKKQQTLVDVIKELQLRGSMVPHETKKKEKNLPKVAKTMLFTRPLSALATGESVVFEEVAGLVPPGPLAAGVAAGATLRFELMQLQAKQSNNTESKGLVGEWRKRTDEMAIGCAIHIVFIGILAMLYWNCWKPSFPVYPPPPADREGEWAFELCEPGDLGKDWRICCFAFCCSAIRWGDTMQNPKVAFLAFVPAVSLFSLLVGLSSLSFGVTGIFLIILLVSGRQRVRNRFGIQSGASTLCTDCCLYMCCTPCAIAQEARQAEYVPEKFMQSEMIGQEGPPGKYGFGAGSPQGYGATPPATAQNLAPPPPREMPPMSPGDPYGPQAVGEPAPGYQPGSRR